MSAPTTTFTAQDVALVREIRRLVAANPDFVYDEGDLCYYVRNGEGSCLIGQALLNIGVDIDELAQYDGGGEYGVSAAKDALPRLGDFSSEVIRWANKVQRGQDDELTWRIALKAADQSYPAVVSA